MAVSDGFPQQAALLVRVLPLVAEEKCFALKGGTAINLFVRDMPRLSGDIDLTDLPVEDRATSLAHIDAAMKRIGDRIRKGIPGARVTAARLQPFRVHSDEPAIRDGIRRPIGGLGLSTTWRILRRESLAMNVPSEIAERVAKLSPYLQEQVLLFVSSLEPSAVKGESGAALVRFAGSLDDVSAREMTQAIEEECERVDAGQW